MSRGTPLKRLSKSKKPSGRLLPATRFLIFITAIGLLGIAIALIWRSVSQYGEGSTVQLDLATDPSLSPIESAGLAAYLALNSDTLNTPTSDDSTLITFTISPGETGREISANLFKMGLISNETLFNNYLRYYGLDRQLEAGSYKLAPSMTIPEIASALTEAFPAELTVRITEGWRREQIADWIDQQDLIPFSGAEFLAASGTGAILPPESPLIGKIPANASLEGFLFPDTYRLATDATAIDLVNRMLRNFGEQVSPQMFADVNSSGLSLYQVVTLASIVEREAVIADERPTIASVYLNRLATGMKLQADPTVQYAMGFQVDTQQWWNLNLTQDDYTAIDLPYNTYLYPGLPPGPIANPSLSSIQAVIYPAETPYLFFRAACDGSGQHTFATTYDDHVANACP